MKRLADLDALPIIGIALFLLAQTSAAALTPVQWCVLDMARDRATGSGLQKTFQAIVLQESSAGTQLVNASDPSYGVAGLTLDTAADILGRPVTAGELVSDTELSLRLGYLHLLDCRAHFGAWRRMVVCYNRGVAGAASRTDAEIDADAYLAAITRRLTELDGIRRHRSLCPRD